MVRARVLRNPHDRHPSYIRQQCVPLHAPITLGLPRLFLQFIAGCPRYTAAGRCPLPQSTSHLVAVLVRPPPPPGTVQERKARAVESKSGKIRNRVRYSNEGELGTFPGGRVTKSDGV